MVFYYKLLYNSRIVTKLKIIRRCIILDLASQMKYLNYIRKLLLSDFTNIVPESFQLSKAAFQYMPNEQPLKRSTPQEQDIDIKTIFDFTQRLQNSLTLNSHAFMVMKKGKVVAEAAFSPYNLTTWHVTHSMCKTITGMAVGLAISENYFTLDDKVCHLLSAQAPLIRSSRLKNLSVRHLLTMTSGVNFREFGLAISNNWSKLFLRSDFKFDPGTVFDYNSMDSYILACIIKETTGLGLVDFLTPRLFAPLGISNIYWSKSQEGVECGGWGLYITIEDMAKLGQLILQNGQWTFAGKATQILPRSWVEEMKVIRQIDNGRNYGYHIWVGPENRYYCFTGLFGQVIYINPQYDMVVVITAGNTNVLGDDELLDIIHATLCPQQLMLLSENNDNSNFSQAQLDELFAKLTYQNHQLLISNVESTLTLLEKIISWWRRLFFKEQMENDETNLLESIPANLMLLVNRNYKFPSNSISVMPLIIQAMSANYTQGISKLSLYEKDYDLWLGWEERDEKFELAIGLFSPKATILNFADEIHQVSCYGIVKYDEDDNIVLKINICFLETSSTRKINICYNVIANTVVFTFFEDPDMNVFFRRLMAQLNVQDNKALAVIMNDPKYLNFLLQQLASPKIEVEPENIEKISNDDGPK